MTVRVLLADDQALLREGFAMIVGSQPDLEIVGEAADGDEAVALTAALLPDVVLMDVRMPRTDGIEATRRITARHPQVRVIILTTFDIDEYAFDGLRAGASGFLLKSARPDEISGRHPHRRRRGRRAGAEHDPARARHLRRHLHLPGARAEQRATCSTRSPRASGRCSPRSRPGGRTRRSPSG